MDKPLTGAIMNAAVDDAQERIKRNDQIAERRYKSRQHPISPPKGESMPQTREYWEKRADMDQKLILEMKAEISKLNHTINQLRQTCLRLSRD